MKGEANMMRWTCALLLLVFATAAGAEPTPDPTPGRGQGSSRYALLSAATAATTPRPAVIGKDSARPAISVCLTGTCTGLTLNPECSLDGINWSAMTVGSGVTIVHGDLTLNGCAMYDVDPACRWFRVRNPTVSSCTHTVYLAIDEP
jgi:hypothetical protein